MQRFRVNLNEEILKWQERMEDFQAYLPHVPWERGELQGIPEPTPWEEEELRVMLDGALTDTYHHELRRIGWHIYDQPYSETISKLAHQEPDLRKRKQEEVSPDPAPGKSDKTSTKKQPKDKCSTCGKRHRVECWHKSSGPSKDKHKKQFNEFLKLMKVVKTEDSEEEEYSTDTSWKKMTTREERAFVMGATADVSDLDASVDSTTAKKLLKKFRKKKKKKKSL